MTAMRLEDSTSEVERFPLVSGHSWHSATEPIDALGTTPFPAIAYQQPQSPQAVTHLDHDPTFPASRNQVDPLSLARITYRLRPLGPPADPARSPGGSRAPHWPAPDPRGQPGDARREGLHGNRAAAFVILGVDMGMGAGCEIDGCVSRSLGPCRSSPFFCGLACTGGFPDGQGKWVDEARSRLGVDTRGRRHPRVQLRCMWRAEGKTNCNDGRKVDPRQPAAPRDLNVVRASLPCLWAEARRARRRARGTVAETIRSKPAYECIAGPFAPSNWGCKCSYQSGMKTGTSRGAKSRSHHLHTYVPSSHFVKSTVFAGEPRHGPSQGECQPCESWNAVGRNQGKRAKIAVQN